MELFVDSNSQDEFLEQLSFKLPGGGASYAQERRLVSAYPTGASTFASNGVKVMRFDVTGENWLDPATLRLAFKLRNTSATDTLQLASGPWCMFDQIRLLIAGQEVEKLGPYYGRSHEFFRHLLMPNDWNIESSIEDGQVYDANSYPQVAPKVIGPGQYLSLNLTPLLAWAAELQEVSSSAVFGWHANRVHFGERFRGSDAHVSFAKLPD